MEILGNGSPALLDYSDTCILLGQSCGTSCTLYVSLPIVSNATERKYLFGKAYNLEESTVAFITDGEPLISVQNYLTNKRMDVFEIVYALRLLMETVLIAVKSQVALFTFIGRVKNGVATKNPLGTRNTR